MEARADGGALLVRGPDGALRLPAEAAPLTWWDPAPLQPAALRQQHRQAAAACSWTRAPLPAAAARAGSPTGDDGAEAHATPPTAPGSAGATRAEDGSTVIYERA